ncbi:helix-turn-helix domain-containing protein [Natrononativus amylolyticus]|uniref:helix-turn-helix domain-containing protein n=1 Tax=Natrononativus amylolyticus TaxID=2963434 RepID=UPI0020CCB276|nr:helix-turn-helix domain-containing protein [Natrononativus amylolyticus]
MTLVVEFRVPAHETALGATFERIPELRCEMEQAITDPIPGFWFQGPTRTALEATFDSDPTVEAYSRVVSDEHRSLYDLEFTDDVCELVSIVLEDGVVLDLSAVRGTWSFHGRYPSHESASRTYDRLVEYGTAVDVAKLRGIEHSNDGHTLTEEQQKTLQTAIEHGFFEIPRGITMEELAARLDISHQAVSERLRRAYKAMATDQLGQNGKRDTDSATSVRAVTTEVEASDC